MQQATHILGHVAIDHEHEQFVAFAVGSQRVLDAARGRGEAGILRIALPRERESETLGRLHVHVPDGVTDCVRKHARVDVACKADLRAHDRNVMDRQHVEIRQVDRLAAHLHGELRSANDGCANALAWIDKRRAAAFLQLRCDFAGEQLCDVAVLAVLVGEDVLRDAAGECERGGARLNR